MWEGRGGVSGGHHCPTLVRLNLQVLLGARQSDALCKDRVRDSLLRISWLITESACGRLIPAFKSMFKLLKHTWKD